MVCYWCCLRSFDNKGLFNILMVGMVYLDPHFMGEINF